MIMIFGVGYNFARKKKYCIWMFKSWECKWGEEGRDLIKLIQETKFVVGLRAKQLTNLGVNPNWLKLWAYLAIETKRRHKIEKMMAKREPRKKTL